MTHKVKYNYLTNKYACQFGSYLITNHENKANYFFFIYHQTLNTSLRKLHLGKFLCVKSLNTSQMLLYEVTHPCWVIYHCVVISAEGQGFICRLFREDYEAWFKNPGWKHKQECVPHSLSMRQQFVKWCLEIQKSG